jgi:hypothetical protein
VFVAAVVVLRDAVLYEKEGWSPINFSQMAPVKPTFGSSVCMSSFFLADLEPQRVDLSMGRGVREREKERGDSKGGGRK